MTATMTASVPRGPAAPLPAPDRFDADAVRAEFPILARRIHGRPLAYLDNAASAQKPQAVIDAMVGVMTGAYANVHRGLHTLANEATEAFEAARGKVAAFLGAAPAEIVFTKGSTDGLNLIAHSLGEGLAPGDEIILSVAEHHSNIVPWHYLRERRGAVIRWVPLREDGGLDLEAYDALLGSRTRVVALTHMSNVTGAVTDIGRIVAGAKAVGARVVLDGSQAAVHLSQVDVHALGVDAYAVTGHKLYGPTGIGALYIRRDLAERLPPYQGGGEMIARVSTETVTYAEPPHRFEAGTPPIVEAIGLGAAIDWLTAIDRRAGEAHERRLAERLTAGLAAWPDVRVLGQTPDKGAIVAFASPGAHAHDVAQILDRYGVAVRAGQHCTEPLMKHFGVTSSARASFALYNTDADVDAFLEGYRKARELLG